MKPCLVFLIPCLFLFCSCHEVVNSVELITTAIEHNKRNQPEEKARQEKITDTSMTVYNKRSKTTSEVEIVAGKTEGPARQYYQNGKLWKEVNYKTGKLHGTAKVYTRKGHLQRSVEYEAGQKHGTYIQYFKSGKPKAEVEYRQDLPMPGYVERNYKGEEKPHPKITITENDLLQSKGEYHYRFGLEPTAKNVKYYILKNENEWSPNNPVLEQFALPDDDSGKGILPLEVEPGYAIHEDFLVYALFTTRSGMKVVVSKKLPVSIENL